MLLGITGLYVTKEFYIKKLDYRSIAKDRGFDFIEENNGRVFVKDEFGLTHSFGCHDFSKGASLNIRSVEKESRTQYYVNSIIKKHPEITKTTSFDKFVFSGANKSSIFTCLEHGDYMTSPSHLMMRGRQCKKCATDTTMSKITIKQEEFIRRSKEKHGDKYDYTKSLYTKSRGFVTVTCKEHGDFEVIASHHYYLGVGCSECVENMTSHSRTDYSKYCPLGSNIYLVVMSNEIENYCKIGITKNLHNRLMKLKRTSGCFVDLLHTEFYEDAGVAWDVEKLLHKDFKEESYTPINKFGGSTECFDVSIQDEVIKLLKTLA